MAFTTEETQLTETQFAQAETDYKPPPIDLPLATNGDNWLMRCSSHRRETTETQSMAITMHLIATTGRREGGRERWGGGGIAVEMPSIKTETKDACH